MLQDQGNRNWTVDFEFAKKGWAYIIALGIYTISRIVCLCNARWWPRAGPMLALCKRPALHVRQRHFRNVYSGNKVTRFLYYKQDSVSV